MNPLQQPGHFLLILKFSFLFTWVLSLFSCRKKFQVAIQDQSQKKRKVKAETLQGSFILLQKATSPVGQRESQYLRAGPTKILQTGSLKHQTFIFHSFKGCKVQYQGIGKFDVLLFSPGSWCTQGFVCTVQLSVSPVLCKFQQLYAGVNGDFLQEGLCHSQVYCTQSACGRPLLTCTSSE